MQINTSPGSRRYASVEEKAVFDVIVLPPELSGFDVTDITYRQALWAGSMLCDIPLVTILGSAGTGKSVLLRMIYRMHTADGDTPLVLAPTGVAVDNLRGSVDSSYTFNRRFRLPMVNWHSYKPYNGNCAADFEKHFRPVLGIRTVLVDEVGMTSCNMLDYLLDFVNDYNRHCPDKWIKVILFGDVLQIPPVVTFSSELEKNLWRDKYGNREYFFNSVNWRRMEKKTFVLKQIHRQGNDIFSGVLDRIRSGSPTEADLKLLNRCVMSLEYFLRRNEKYGYVHLAYTNKAVEVHNARCMEKYMGMFLADAEGDTDSHGDVLAHTYTATLPYDERSRSLDEVLSSDFPSILKEVRLFVGMQVICTANHYRDRRAAMRDDRLDNDYFNGNLGIINRFVKREDPVTGIEEMLPVVMIPGRGETVIFTHSFTRSELRLNPETGVSENVKTTEVIAIGCKPAYAMTYHKSQSLTLPSVYLDLDSLPKGRGKMIPTPSLVYLGLSRVRSLADIGLSRELKMEDILVSDEVTSFLKELPSIMEQEESLDFFGAETEERVVDLV